MGDMQSRHNSFSLFLALFEDVLYYATEIIQTKGEETSRLFFVFCFVLPRIKKRVVYHMLRKREKKKIAARREAPLRIHIKERTICLSMHQRRQPLLHSALPRVGSRPAFSLCLVSNNRLLYSKNATAL
jgi:hypothetical protein